MSAKKVYLYVMTVLLALCAAWYANAGEWMHFAGCSMFVLSTFAQGRSAP